MDAILSIICDELSDDVLQKITFDVCNTVNKEIDATASTVEQAGGAGHKGDAITIGQIFLTALGSGGAIVALINVFKTYVGQRPSIKFNIKKKDGDAIMIEAKNLTKEQYSKILRILEDYIGG